MPYPLLAVGGIAPDYAIAISDIIVAIAGIGVHLPIPIITGVISGSLIRGSNWFAGLGIGFLAGVAAIGLSILLLWTGYKLFNLAGLEIIYISISAVVCSAVTIAILWLIRDRKYRGAGIAANQT